MGVVELLVPAWSPLGVPGQDLLVVESGAQGRAEEAAQGRAEAAKLGAAEAAKQGE